MSNTFTQAYLFGNTALDPERNRRVAIYGRVSTQHEAQIDALGNQMQWYEDQLRYHPNWQVVDRYIDDTAIMGLNQNPVQTGVDLVPFFFLSALFSANEGVPA